MVNVTWSVKTYMELYYLPQYSFYQPKYRRVDKKIHETTNAFLL